MRHSPTQDPTAGGPSAPPGPSLPGCPGTWLPRPGLQAWAGILSWRWAGGRVTPAAAPAPARPSFTSASAELPTMPPIQPCPRCQACRRGGGSCQHPDRDRHSLSLLLLLFQAGLPVRRHGEVSLWAPGVWGRWGVGGVEKRSGCSQAPVPPSPPRPSPGLWDLPGQRLQGSPRNGFQGGREGACPSGICPLLQAPLPGLP